MTDGSLKGKNRQRIAVRATGRQRAVARRTGSESVGDRVALVSGDARLFEANLSRVKKAMKDLPASDAEREKRILRLASELPEAARFLFNMGSLTDRTFRRIAEELKLSARVVNGICDLRDLVQKHKIQFFPGLDGGAEGRCCYPTSCEADDGVHLKRYALFCPLGYDCCTRRSWCRRCAAPARLVCGRPGGGCSGPLVGGEFGKG